MAFSGFLSNHVSLPYAPPFPLVATFVVCTQFGDPSAIAIFSGANPTDTEYMYVTDSATHVVRAITADCAKMCENGGRCVGTERCLCPPGWVGEDCATPNCTTPCSLYVCMPSC